MALVIFLSSRELKKEDTEKPEHCDLQLERKVRVPVRVPDSMRPVMSAFQVTGRGRHLSWAAQQVAQRAPLDLCTITGMLISQFRWKAMIKPWQRTAETCRARVLNF